MPSCNPETQWIDPPYNHTLWIKCSKRIAGVQLNIQSNIFTRIIFGMSGSHASSGAKVVE
ncbi:MAG: hypothetical protein VR75_11120 [Hyphomonadaceae bacterium BRH_c29]|nr:MAG: hypothetical protein VR75_11120 [Hyphomonadaceae bacterium BRH_c29]